MTPELQEVQRRLDLQYLKSNAAARDGRWLALESMEARAEMDPTRFLREQFVSAAHAAPGDKVIVLKTHARAEIHEVAELLGLEHQSANAPLNTDGSRPSPNRWLVVAKSRSAVFAKISEISRDAQRTQQRAKEAMREETEEQHQGVSRQLTASQKSGTWNVVGSWSIQSPCFEDFRENGNEKATLDIYLLNEGRRCQIFAIFDFIFVTGIMRFIDPNFSQASAGKRGRRLKEDNEEDEEEKENEDEDEEQDSFAEFEEEQEQEEEEEEQSSDEFYLDHKSRPSHSTPTWKYRWRGEETGEGEIQSTSDENTCSITFKDPGGTRLKGKFKSGICGEECHFSGLKISSTPSSRMPDPSGEWAGRSERAYEYARVARWR